MENKDVFNLMYDLKEELLILNLHEVLEIWYELKKVLENKNLM